VDFVNLILLALAATVYPTLLAGVLLILTQPNPLRMLVGFLVGGMAISVIAGFVLVKVLEASDVVSKSHSSSKPIADIVIGAASLLVAGGVWSGHIKRGFRKRKAPEPQQAQKPSSSLTSRVLSRGSVTMAFIVGLVLNLPGVWYLDALVGIAKAKSSTASALLQILVFNVIMFALVEVPIVAYLVDPDRAASLVNKLLGLVSPQLALDRDRGRPGRGSLAAHEGNRRPGEMTAKPEVASGQARAPARARSTIGTRPQPPGQASAPPAEVPRSPPTATVAAASPGVSGSMWARASASDE